MNSYEKYKDHFTTHGRRNDDTACDNFNRWLDQRKSFFTYGKKCKKNLELWNTYIEPLWNDLQKNNNNTKCIRKDIFSATTEFPSELPPPICYKHVPEEHICFNPTEKNPSICDTYCYKCKRNSIPVETPAPERCPSFDTSLIPPQVQNQNTCNDCPSTTSAVILSAGTTLFGTIFLFFFLYKVI